MARTEVSDYRLNYLDKKFRELLDTQFEYTADTERNRDVKRDIQSDVWCIFHVLLESDDLSEKAKTKIYNLIAKEIRRRNKLFADSLYK
tara:strand:+ start:202 stop:468 length:267 start_codon:yes stop_codon:yes gene_type:complete